MHTSRNYSECSTKDRCSNFPTDEVENPWERVAQAFQELADRIVQTASALNPFKDFIYIFDPGMPPDEYGRILAGRKTRKTSNRHTLYKADSKIQRNLPYQKRNYKEG